VRVYQFRHIRAADQILAAVVPVPTPPIQAPGLVVIRNTMTTSVARRSRDVQTRFRIVTMSGGLGPSVSSRVPPAYVLMRPRNGQRR
jgi:hypothetical protein